jgi:hypothetical protein
MHEINWKEIKNFHPSEFSEDPDQFADPMLIKILQGIRKAWGKPIYPSPAKGALARFDEKSSKSQHYAVNRKSTAGDIFPEGIPIDFLHLLFCIPALNGIGIYRDTIGPDGTAWPMFHIDIRPTGLNKFQPIFWIMIKNVFGDTIYNYPFKDPQMLTLLMDKRFYIEKKWRN